LNRARRQFWARAAIECARLHEVGLRRDELEAHTQQKRAGRQQVVLGLKANFGLGRIVALPHHSSTSYHIH
jgi:hypothetical protein